MGEARRMWLAITRVIGQFPVDVDIKEGGFDRESLFGLCLEASLM